MSTVTVSSTAQLLAALKTAVDGDKILLASGTYSKISITNINIPGNVTIESADPSHRALLTDLAISKSSGLTFSQVNMQPTSADRMYTISTYYSHDIHFDKIDVSGPAGAIGYNVSPFLIRESSDVSVTNSEFHHVWNALSIVDNDGLTIQGNYFHDIRTDGVRGGGSSNVLISDNYFTDFHSIAGDHSDAIQVWTTGTTTSAHDITITDNLIYRGAGTTMQGVFMRDETETTPYQNVLISGNIVVGAMYNGIALGNSTASAVTNNMVIGLPDQKSWISTASAADLVLSGNTAAIYQVNNSSVSPAGNLVAATTTDAGASALTAWLAAHSRAGDIPALLSSAARDILTSLPAVKATAAFVASSSPYQDISGTAGADTLSVGKIFNANVYAGRGNDVLNGSATGDHMLYGGAGDDIYRIYGAGDHIIETPAAGSDTVYAYISYAMADNVETLRMGMAGLVGTGNGLDNRMIGTAGTDEFHGGNGADTIQGGDGDDLIFGDAGADDLRGDGGDDYIYGGLGDDAVSGGDGDDLLDGGAGNDKIEGGAGFNTMTGGAGADTFTFRPTDFVGAAPGVNDVITDFSSLQKDKISLSLIDANTTTARDDAFTFIGTAAFTHKAGQLHYEVIHGDAYVSGDTNGDGVADFTILLQHVTSVAASDFIM